jgi:pterin-4a-carbinolamine dehydratase
MGDPPNGWETRLKPPNLLRRFASDRYGDVCGSLDVLVAPADETGIHPQNVNFGSTYVHIILETVDGKELTEGDYALAARINDLSTSKAG